jgi:hypothetical protein
MRAKKKQALSQERADFLTIFKEEQFHGYQKKNENYGW